MTSLLTILNPQILLLVPWFWQYQFSILITLELFYFLKNSRIGYNLKAIKRAMFLWNYMYWNRHLSMYLHMVRYREFWLFYEIILEYSRVPSTAVLLFRTTFLLILRKKNPSYIFIQYCFFINFQEKFAPTLLFRPTVVFGTLE